MPINVNHFHIPVFACAPLLSGHMTSTEYLSEMGIKVFSLYEIFQTIALLFLILSIAKHGYDILLATLFGKSDTELGKIKMRLFLAVCAILCLVVLPRMIGWAKGMSLPNAWKPPTDLEPLQGEWSPVENNGSGASGNNSAGANSPSNGGTDAAPLSTEPGSYKLRFTDSATSEYMDYYLFIPEGATVNMPLIVFLHGAGEVGKIDSLSNYGMISSAKSIYGNEFPFIAVNPCTHTASWTSSSVTPTLKSLIDWLVSRYNIDRSRIIITGHSLGSMGVWEMVSDYGSYFSAAVPVSSGPSTVLDYARCAEVPIKAYYGSLEADYYTGMNKACTGINNAGGNATLDVLDGLNHPRTKDETYTRTLFNWMLSQ